MTGIPLYYLDMLWYKPDRTNISGEEFPLEVCLSGAESRIGKKREDSPWIESEFDLEFRQWIIPFSKDQLPYIYELLEKYQKAKNIVIFRSGEEADNYLKIM